MTTATPVPYHPRRFIGLYLQLGKLLFLHGATVQRVIDSVHALKNYLGGDEIQVLIEYDGLMITDIQGQHFHTRVERRGAFVTFNIAVLIAVSQLIRRLEIDRPSPDQIRQRLREIEGLRSPLRGWAQHLLVGLVALAFGIVNGADDMACAAILSAAVLLSLLKKVLLGRGQNLYLSMLLAGLAAVLVSGLLASLLGTATGLVAIIAVLLPQVPGFPLINAGLDILRNHNTVAWGRLAYAGMMIIILTLAASVPLLILFNSLQVETAPQLGLWLVRLADALFAGVAAMGLGLLFNVPGRFIPLLGLGGILARGIRTELVALGGLDIAVAAFIGAAAVSVLMSLVARRGHFPSAVFALICVLPMIPGFLAIDGLNHLFLLTQLAPAAVPPEMATHTLQTLLKTAFTIAALIFGVIFPIFLIEGRSPRV
ncbi:MAG TPA: threonine/serine exporter family protein [Chromatiaceae bacterium]|nr:threonine/serine exporter family protein [Chromatiaceae bacterium]